MGSQMKQTRLYFLFAVYFSKAQCFIKKCVIFHNILNFGEYLLKYRNVSVSIQFLNVNQIKKSYYANLKIFASFLVRHLISEGIFNYYDDEFQLQFKKNFGTD